MIKFEIINIPTRFVVINDIRINANELARTLEEFVSEEYDINGYNLSYISIANDLVREGVLEKYIGSRMAHLYKKTDKFDQYYKEFFEEYYKEIEG